VNTHEELRLLVQVKAERGVGVIKTQAREGLLQISHEVRRFVELGMTPWWW